MAKASKVNNRRGESKPLSMEFSLSLREYTSAVRHRVRWVPALFVLLALGSLAADALELATLELALAVGTFVLPTAMSLGAARQSRLECVHYFDEDGHTFRSAIEEVRHSWQRFDCYSETSKLFLLRSHGAVEVIVPKRVFVTVSEERRFRVLLASKLGTVASRGRDKRPETIVVPPRRRKRQLASVNENVPFDVEAVVPQTAIA